MSRYVAATNETPTRERAPNDSVRLARLTIDRGSENNTVLICRESPRFLQWTSKWSCGVDLRDTADKVPKGITFYVRVVGLFACMAPCIGSAAVPCRWPVLLNGQRSVLCRDMPQWQNWMASMRFFKSAMTWISTRMTLKSSFSSLRDCWEQGTTPVMRAFNAGFRDMVLQIGTWGNMGAR